MALSTQEKIKKLDTQLKALKSKERKEARKARTHELIEIGAVVSKEYDRPALFKTLKTYKPKFVILSTAPNGKKTQRMTSDPKELEDLKETDFYAYVLPYTKSKRKSSPPKRTPKAH